MYLGGENMSQCPFWSSSKEVIECNRECPMANSMEDGEECVFKSYLGPVSLKEIKNVSNSLEFEEEFEEDYFIKKLKVTPNY